MILKGEFNFLLVQLSVFWNFSQGYLRPCTDTNLRTPNGTAVYAEIGKPVSVLFCVENGTTVHHAIQIKESSHQAIWIPANNINFGTGKESRVVTNITINNVQKKDLNVTFSVMIFTDSHVSGGYRNDGKLIFTFMLQKQASIRLCRDSSEWSPNGTNVNARVGGSVRVVFCVTSEVTIHKHVYINYPSSRSRWYPPQFDSNSHKQNNDTEVEFQEEENRTKITIEIKNVGAEDFKANFSVKVMSEQHILDHQTSNEFVFFMFQLLQEVSSTESIHSGSTSKSEVQNTITKSTSANISRNFSADTTSAVMGKAEVTVATTNGTSTLSTTAAPQLRSSTPQPVSVYPALEPGQNPRDISVPLQITKFSMETSVQPAQTITRDLMKPNDIIRIAPHENNMSLTCVASGNPEPKITILHNNVTLVSSRGEAHRVIQNIRCQDSGVYTCQVKNRFNSTQIQKTIQIKRPDKIESFTIRPKQPVSNGSNATMVCTAAKCSEPLTMTIVDDTGIVKKKVIHNESLAHEIRNVQCSDMGTYFCRVETDKSQTLEEQLDLEILKCAPQVCRGEDKTKTVHAFEGQSLKVSVCIMSYYTLSWQNPQTYSRVHVSFTPRTPISLYYTVTIIISGIQKQDQGNKKIRLYSGYWSMNYTINLQVDTITSTTAISSSSPPSPATTTASPAGSHVEGAQLTTNSESGINVVYIALPLAVVIAIVVFILGVIIYRRKGAGSRTRKARTGDVGATNEGEYANLKELDSATGPVVEQEQVTSVTRDGGQELASDFSDQDSGRFLSEQGLVYISIAHVANSKKKKEKKKQETKTPDKWKTQGGKKDTEEPVEYTTIDFEKSGKQVITEEEEQKSKDEEKQENELADKKEETEKNEEKHDENSS